MSAKSKNENQPKLSGCPLCKILKPILRVGLLLVIVLLAIIVGAGLQNQVLKQFEEGYANTSQKGITLKDVSEVAWYRLSGDVVDRDELGFNLQLDSGKIVKVLVNENTKIFKNEDCCSEKEDRLILKDEIVEGNKVEVESLENIIGKTEVFGHKITVL